MVRTRFRRLLVPLAVAAALVLSSLSVGPAAAEDDIVLTDFEPPTHWTASRSRLPTWIG
ncbi:MAG TPA: hypothetical protein VI076_10845 [Actinopolymorphaceae bacterium]